VEGLLLLLAGIIAPFFSAVLVIGGEAVALATALLCNIVLTLFKVPPLPPKPAPAPVRGTRTATPAKPTAPVPVPPPSGPRVRRVMRLITRTCAVILVVTLLGTYVLNALLYEATLRWILAGIHHQTGIETTFHEAQGNLWSGMAGMSRVRIRRENHPHSNFDVKIDELLIDVGVLRLWRGEFALEEFRAQDVQGRIEWLEAPDDRQRHPFRIDRVQVDRVDVKWTDRTRDKPVEARLEIGEFRCEAFRSNWAAFDTLFRANTSGRIAGQPFMIVSGPIDGGRQTRWKADALPAQVVGPYLGGPFGWIEEGKIDLDVTDRWQLENIASPRLDAADIAMDWNLVFRDLKIAPPPHASAMQRKLGEPVAKFLTAHGDRVALEFELTLNAGQFAGRASVETSGLLKDLAKAAAFALAKKVGEIGGK
jgi:hypothetical protein